MRKHTKAEAFFLGIAILIVFFLSSPISEATSGCCSWHGGVSHCDTSVGKQVCNDGSYSPSCGCTYITPKPVVQNHVKKLNPVGTTNLAGQVKYCGYGELFSSQNDADKSKADAINSAKQPLITENDNIKKENQKLQSTISSLNSQKNDGGSFGGGALLGIIGTSGLAWYISRKKNSIINTQPKA